MKSIQHMMAEYSREHANKTNQLIHMIAIPAALFGALIFLSWAHIGFGDSVRISFAWLFTIAVLVYYFFLDIKLACVATIVFFIFTAIASGVASNGPGSGNFFFAILCLAGGLGGLFAGHMMYEKNKPDYVHGLGQIIVAPLFFIIDALKKFGLAKHFDCITGSTESSEPMKSQQHTHRHEDDHKNNG